MASSFSRGDRWRVQARIRERKRSKIFATERETKGWVEQIESLDRSVKLPGIEAEQGFIFADDSSFISRIARKIFAEGTTDSDP